MFVRFYPLCVDPSSGDWPQPENKKGLPFQVSLMWYRNVSSDTNTPNSLPLQARMMMGVDVMN